MWRFTEAAIPPKTDEDVRQRRSSVFKSKTRRAKCIDFYVAPFRQFYFFVYRHVFVK